MRLARLSSVRSLAAIAVPLGVLFGASGCGEAVYYETEPVVVESPGPVVWVETSPVVVIDDYPCEYYEGRTVYYIDGRWYYTEGGRWAYYRVEPTFLYQRRYYYDDYGYRTASGEHRYRANPTRDGATASAPPEHSPGSPEHSGGAPDHSSGTPEHSSNAPGHAAPAHVSAPAPAERSAQIEQSHAPAEHTTSLETRRPRPATTVTTSNTTTTTVAPARPPAKRSGSRGHRRGR